MGMAIKLFEHEENLVTDFNEPACNGFYTFCILPDGYSRNGSPTCQEMDSKREKFKDYLKTTGLSWAEIYYGGDDYYAELLDFSHKGVE